MRKTTLLFGLALVAVCSVTAQAQMPDPTVYDIYVQHYDIGALKAGEWVEYETDMGMAGVPKSKQKWACVGVEGDTVWIETDAYTAQMHPGTLILLGVDKNTRKVTKAFWGKPGEVGKELKVQALGGGAATDGEQPETTGTAKVSKETLKVGGADVECEKVEYDTKTKSKAGESTSKMTTWVSDKVPFKYFVDEKATTGANYKVKWEGKSEVKGGGVKTYVESQYAKMTTMLVGFGTDAKQQVKSK